MTGRLVGRARLVDCVEISRETFESNIALHHVPRWKDVEYERVYAWVLESASRLERRFLFHHRPGASVWVSADVSAEKCVKKTASN